MHAQSYHVRFDRLSIDDGLSNTYVTCILQDHKGFMWFGTKDGLNKYDGYAFTVYRHDPSNPNSLPDNYVTSMYVDETNVLWIGTENGGVCRFDPTTNTFTRYHHEPENSNSLSHNTVRAILGDSGLPGSPLWVGTNGGGLDRLDRATGTFTHFTHDPRTPNSPSNNYIRAIHRDRAGTLWVGTAEGLNKLVESKREESDGENPYWTRYLHDPANPGSLSHSEVLSITEDREGGLWIGTFNGVNRFVPSENSGHELILDRNGEGTFVKYWDAPEGPGIKGNYMMSMLVDQFGILWIGTHHGLTKFDQKTEAFTNYRNDTGDPHSLSGNSVRTIYEDRSGLMWFGTGGSGLSKLNRIAEDFQHYRHVPGNPNSLSHPSVRGIYEDEEGILWVGGYGGLNRIERKRGKFTHYGANDTHRFRLGTHLVYAISGDGNDSNVLWIGSEGDGLYKFHKKRGTIGRYLHQSGVPDPDAHYTLSDNFVHDLYSDPMGFLWIATDNGLNRLDKATGKITQYHHDPGNAHSLSSDQTRVIHEDHSGLLWIGTEASGLNRFDREGELFTRFEHDSDDSLSLSNNRIKSIHEDRNHNLWVGTDGGGMNLLHTETETFTHYTEQDGLPNNVIYGILEDDNGNLWLSTNRGISRFNPLTKTFRNYGVDHGLQSNEFNTASYYRSKSGEMFFGGINGLSAFYPERIRDDPYVPPVVITDFQIFNESIPVGPAGHGRSILQKSILETDQVRLTYKDGTFSFEFAALSYAAPEMNSYAYRMEGFDRDWVYTDGTRRFATYTHLSAGDYVFRVKGSNHDGVWNEVGTSLKLTITPPLWKTWWAYGIYLVLFLTIGQAVYFRRVNQLKKEAERQHELTRSREHAREVLSEKIIESQEQERKRIAAEMHDGLGQDLLIIKNMALMGLDPGAGEEDMNASLSRISDAASGVIEEVRKIARDLRPFQLDRLGVTKALESLIVSASGSSNIHFSSSIDNIDTLFPADREIHLYRILQESISNIIKHSDASEALVIVEKQDDRVFLTIKDDGKGFSPDELDSDLSLEHGLGLSGMAERARILGTKLEIESRPGQGTTLSMALTLA